MVSTGFPPPSVIFANVTTQLVIRDSTLRRMSAGGYSFLIGNSSTTVRVSNSLIQPPDQSLNSDFVCIGAFNAAFAPLNADCQ